MQQDKNFSIRLKAAVERRLKETGVIRHMISPPEAYSSDDKKAWWNFIESLDTITLPYLQGEENHCANSTIEKLKKGDRFKFNYDTFIVNRKWIDDDKKPLIAVNEKTNEEHKFYHEGLEIEKL